MDLANVGVWLWQFGTWILAAQLGAWLERRQYVELQDAPPTIVEVDLPGLVDAIAGDQVERIQLPFAPAGGILAELVTPSGDVVRVQVAQPRRLWLAS